MRERDLPPPRAPFSHVICITCPRSSGGGQRERRPVAYEARCVCTATPLRSLTPECSPLRWPPGRPDAANANIVTSSTDCPLNPDMHGPQPPRHLALTIGQALGPPVASWFHHTTTCPPSAQAPWMTPHPIRDRPQVPSDEVQVDPDPRRPSEPRALQPPGALHLPFQPGHSCPRKTARE